MELSTNKKVWKPLIIIFIIMCFITYLLFYFSDLFVIFIIGSLIILITDKTHKRFSKIIEKFRFHESKLLKTLFIVITILIWIIIIYFLIVLTKTDINTTINYMSEQNSTIKQIYFEKAQAIFGSSIIEKINSHNIAQNVDDYLISAGTKITRNTLVFFAMAIIIIPLMFTNYFKKRNIFKKTIALITPKKFNKGITGIINESSKKLKNYSHAKLLESFIIAVICGIGFSIAGLKGWLLFAIICGILNIIPYIGPWMGAVGPILVSLLDPSISTFIITAITMIIAQTIDSFYIIPFMIPKQLKINPLVSIILIIIAAKLFGPLGMLMAIPIYAIYVVILEGTYRELVKIHDPKHYKKVFNKK